MGLTNITIVVVLVVVGYLVMKLVFAPQPSARQSPEQSVRHVPLRRSNAAPTAQPSSSTGIPARRFQLRDIEPWNLAAVNNREAAAFMSHLTGHETFELSSAEKPR
jgi:hypothetical protein